jgi:hypothetical protein
VLGVPGPGGRCSRGLVVVDCCGLALGFSLPLLGNVPARALPVVLAPVGVGQRGGPGRALLVLALRCLAVLIGCGLRWPVALVDGSGLALLLLP